MSRRDFDCDPERPRDEPELRDDDALLVLPRADPPRADEVFLRLEPVLLLPELEPRALRELPLELVFDLLLPPVREDRELEAREDDDLDPEELLFRVLLLLDFEAMKFLPYRLR
ncbi:MAG TPA: hypothetical protein VFB79_19585 [Candidatus Angelobacter sp.]|nr:hypothetical protein [Candidatus Angelobacter sp.]